jgi:hypothetical protein
MGTARWAALAIATSIMAAGALALALPGDVDEPGPAPAPDRRGGSIFHDPARRFTVEIPTGWERTREVVIPEVTNPREILVVSTFRLDGFGEPCGPFYDHVLGRMGPREGLVALQERLGRKLAGPRVFPARPADFRLAPRRLELRGCGRQRGRRPVRDWWIPFRSAGRDFYAQVAVGPRAPDALRRDASRLLDSLRFERRRGNADGGGLGRRERAAFARLEARRLRLPALGADEKCPLANAVALPVVPAEAALGPGGPTERGVAKLREGPVYVAFPGIPRILDFQATGDGSSRAGGWRSAEVLWVSRASYRGPVLVRGGQLDGPGRLGFGRSPHPRSQLRLPAGDWTVRRGPLRVWGRTVQPRTGWRTATAPTRISRTGKAGIRCYAFQVDGNSFSYTIAFGGVRQG